MSAEPKTDQGEQALQEQYFRHIPRADLKQRPPECLSGAVRSHLDLAHDRPQGTSKVRAQVPSRERDGWDADGHMVVEIVTEDRPFLVDSVMSFLLQEGFGIDRVIHPQLAVRRDITGVLRSVEPEGTEGNDIVRESWMHLELDLSSDPDAFATIEDGLQRVLRDVQDVVDDWPKMQEQALDMIEQLREDPPPVPESEIADAADLLSWLTDGHFTFMGYREYELIDEAGEDQLRIVPQTGLGLLRGDQRVSGAFNALPADVRSKARTKNLLIVSKANSRATVHRSVYMDYIGVKTFDASGEVTGERRFLGLFTSVAYTESVARIPILNRKAEAIRDRLGYTAESHSGKALVDLLETYPRDELFQMSVDELVPIAEELLQLRERRRLRLFLRRDDYGRFLSCLVYLPRDRYTTDVRRRIEKILISAIGGDPTIDYTVWVTDLQLARVHLVVRPQRGQSIGEIDEGALEQRVVDATRSWEDDFTRAIEDILGDAAKTETMREYADAFPEAYKEDFGARTAVADLARIDRLGRADAGDVALDFEPSLDGAHGGGQFKIFRAGSPLELTEVLPYFSALGVDVVDERPYHINRTSGPAWVYDFGLRYRGEIDEHSIDLFKDAFLACWRGAAEADGFNRLVLGGGFTWRQVVIVRAYAKYLRQVGTPFSQDYIEACLLDNVPIVKQLVELFQARFDPQFGEDRTARTEAFEKIEKSLATALDDVTSLDADRILRSYVTLIGATSRTNYYQTGEDGRPKAYVSLKLEPRSIDDLPEPRPRYEIFCYSPRVEGVHLRFGPVSRGGLRWSDRREDFRTEILGLVKAQMVKNAVIVPVGSKGGFFCKQLPDAGDREAWMAEGVACYKTFISSLLDLTDNRRGHEAVPPRDVVRWDDDDTYLVVAADKGTATFSDIANQVSVDYGYWLGDAFASGGSVGYDHKAMGITARGAWVSVQRHFREMGIDCQNEDFTCVGVGDMSGDVFGNGMLLSEHTRLLAAFDHRHVFVDPDPDPDVPASYAERRRLFDLPRSSWADYDESLISEGGGIFARTLKSIPVSPQMRAALDLDDDVQKMTPPQLLTAILRAPVDLLWNGGIGTYVKATSETQDEVGDKANNAIRVNGSQLRCRCVGEGGNLGLTQLGRIEYARAGGRINTDFIDNSAGVDTSDHEVNIKILLGRVIEGGDLDTDGRNELLPTMTEEVAQLVLEDNYDQNISLAGSVHDSVSLLHSHAGWINRLERSSLIDREIEFLPSEKEIDNRRAEGVGLTAPELSVLLAYTKIVLADELIDSDVADDDYFRTLLFRYFPSALRQRYRAAMEQHPLRREIIVTAIVNEMVNAAGITFFHRLSGETGASASELARAHAIASEIYDSPAMSTQVNSLDNVVPAEVQEHLRGTLQALTERASRWLVNNRRNDNVEESVEYFGTLVQRLVHGLPDLLVGRELEAWRARVERLRDNDVPEELATRFASLGPAYAALTIADNARRNDIDVATVASVHFALGESLGLDLLADSILALPRDDRWRTMARAALRDDLQYVHAELTARVLEGTDPARPAQERVDAWKESEGAVLERADNTLQDIWAEDAPDLARLSVGLRVVRTMLT